MIWTGSHKRSGAPVAIQAAAVVLGAPAAEAHLMTTGLGPTYDGIWHFALSPDDAIPVLALALLAGLRGTAHSRRVLFVLPVAWLLGGLAGLVISAPPMPDTTWLFLIALGGLVAADLRLSTSATTILALVLGLFHGYLNGSGMPAMDPRPLVGIAATVFVLVALVSAGVVAVGWVPFRIGVRVAGSWAAATGMLLFGWWLR